VSERSDSLHLDCVSLVERVVKNTGSVDYLPLRVFVIAVTHEEILGSEGVRLHINISLRHIVDEAGLTDVRETSHDKGARVCVDLG
jgi:hypothetical protein